MQVKSDAGSTEESDLLMPPGSQEPEFSRREWYVSPQRRVWRPPTDVYETDGSVVVKVEIAGMTEEDFTISFVDRRLVIGGKRRDPVGKLVYQNMEIRYGEFRTEVRVGWALDEAAIEAVYEGGFLYVYLPKEAQRHRIPVTRLGDDL
ncbi:MAG: Hsp20/alpha crystallin family protein [Chloroflexi bacterium]|nr:Hsp20/alpha crystallin family protein [Chloroflexota bacterium]